MEPTLINHRLFNLRDYLASDINGDFSRIHPPLFLYVSLMLLYTSLFLELLVMSKGRAEVQPKQHVHRPTFTFVSTPSYWFSLGRLVSVNEIRRLPFSITLGAFLLLIVGQGVIAVTLAMPLLEILMVIS
jgi:hypothetical protein